MSERRSTRTGPLPRRSSRPPAAGALLAALLAAGFLLSLFRPAVLSLRARGRLLDGGWAAAWQESYEHGLFLRPLAVQLWGAFRYGLFREGRPGVLVGTDGWLFTTEEFAAGGQGAEGEQAVSAAVGRVRAARDELRARGIGLVVALVPSKARIYPDRLGARRWPARAEALYQRFRGALLAEGIAAPDLTGPMREARARGEVFLRTDTHWSPLGARTAARAVADAGRAVLSRAGTPPATFRTQPAGSRTHPGDLLAFIPLGAWQGSLGPAPDTVEVLETVPEAPGHLGLFDAVQIPVTLVGTSYSAGRLWNFEGALKQALGADVLNVAEEGRGPFAPMRDWLAGDTLRDHPPVLVVWEIPERYITAAE